MFGASSFREARLAPLRAIIADAQAHGEITNG
jgi:hypothetical protein